MIKIYWDRDLGPICTGEADQKDLTESIKKGEEDMVEDRIQQIEKDIETYREAIANAEGSIAAAELELNEEIERRYKEGLLPE